MDPAYLFTSKWTFALNIAQMVISVLSLPLSITILYVLATTKAHSGAFFTIFKVGLLYDIAAVVIHHLIGVLPTRGFIMSDEFMESQFYLKPYFFIVYLLHCCQSITNTLICLNRATAVILPFLHQRIWSHPYCLPCCFLVQISGGIYLGHLTLHHQLYLNRYSTGERFPMVLYSEAARQFWFNLFIFLLVSCIEMMMLYGVVLWKFREKLMDRIKSRNSTTESKRVVSLLCIAIAVVGVEDIYCAYYYYIFVFDVNPKACRDFRTFYAIFYCISDLYSCLPSYLLMAFFKPVRQQVTDHVLFDIPPVSTMCDLQPHQLVEIEYWRDKAFLLSRSDKLGNIVTNSLELIQSVIDSGPQAETLPLKTKALFLECTTIMANDPFNEETHRSLLYGMSFSICALLNSLKGAFEQDHRVEPKIKPECEASHDHKDSMDVILKRILCSSDDPASRSMSSAHMDDSNGSEEAKETPDQMDEFPVNDSMEAARSDKESSQALKSNTSTPRKQKLAHPRLLLKNDEVKKSRKAAVSVAVKEKENPNQKSNVCDKRFKKSTQLKIHMRYHTGEKPFKCSKCRNAFRQRQQLKNHLDRKHGIELDSRKRGTPKRLSLVSSQRNKRNSVRCRPKGSPEKVHQCPHCEKNFPFESKLITHVRRHTGEKPFKCDECESSFKENCDLRKHQRSVHDFKPFECPLEVCRATFKFNSELVEHKKLHTHQISE